METVRKSAVCACAPAATKTLKIKPSDNVRMALFSSPYECIIPGEFSVLFRTRLNLQYCCKVSALPPRLVLEEERQSPEA
jgi:hypothetical protein